MDIVEYNRQSWNRQSASGESRWCEPVDTATINAARRGNWQLILTPNRNVPGSWFGDIRGKRVLCLASGGGQQAPVLAAAGASVTSFDASEEQLEKDAFVAGRDNLPLAIERGDMADLSRFADASFDLIFHPVANVFACEIQPVWRGVENLLPHFSRVEGSGHFEQSIGERGLAVIDMRDDTEIAYMPEVHVGDDSQSR